MKTSRAFLTWLILAVFAMQLPAQTVNETKKVETDSSGQSSKDKMSLQIQTYEGLIRDIENEPEGVQSLAPILTRLGNLYFNTQDYPKAINAYIRSIIIREFNKSRTGFRTGDLGWHLIEVGNSLYRLEDYRLAEYPFQMALKAFSAIDGPKGIEGLITATNNIGLCRLNSGDPAGALPVFTTTLRMSEKYGESQRIYISHVYISMCHLQLKNFNTAISILCNPQMMRLAEADSPLNMFRLQQLGKTYFESGKADSAIYVYKKIADLPSNANLAIYISEACIELANYYFSQNDLGAAMTYALKAEENLTFFTSNQLQMSADRILYQIYKKKGNHREALRFYESFNVNQGLANSIQLESFIDDYNKKAERISFSLEMAQIDAQRIKAEAEKTNQKNMSFFMIVITMLLLLMMFTGKGFEPRIQLLEEFVNEFSATQKTMGLAVLFLYFTAFFYFFIPVEHVMEIQQHSFIMRLLPGVLAFFVFAFVVFVFYKIQSNKQAESRDYRSYLILFGALYLAVFLCEYILFSLSGFTSFNFLLSLSLIVLASYVVPFYLALMVVERLIIKRFETLSASLTNDISQIKQSITPTEEAITIQSEKTSGKILFNIADFIAVEAQGNYCMFYIMRKDVVTRKLLHTTMKSLEAQLAEHTQIIRCHKSFLINIHQITRVSGNSRGYVLHFAGDIEPVPVSRGYQKDVMIVIKQFREGLS